MEEADEETEKSQLISPESARKDWGQRHVVLLFSFLAMFFANALMHNMSVAIVAMVNRTETMNSVNISSTYRLHICPERPTTTSTNSVEGDFNWDSTIQGLVISSFYYGYFMTFTFGGQLAQYFGGRPILAASMGVTAVINLLVPVLSGLDARLLIAARVIQGIAFGGIYPASYVLISKWAPMSEKSRFGAITFAGKNLGITFTTLATGFLSNTRSAGGWRTSFYLMGGLALVWVLLLLLLTAENPERHKNISNKELKYILSTTGSREKRDETPWRAMLTSGPVWAMIVGHTGILWAFNAVVHTLPIYLNVVLRFTLSENGSLSAFSTICMMVVEILGSMAADFLLAKKVFSVLNIRRISTALGIFPSCACILGLGFVGCDQVAGVILLCLGTGLMGFSSFGFMISQYDVAPRHAGTVGGICNGISTIATIVAPSVVMAITDGKPNFIRWRWVFIESSAVYAVTGTVCLILTQAEEQPWAKAQTDCQDKDKQSATN